MNKKIIKKYNTWYFDEYFEDLQANISLIPSEIKDFVLNPDRYLFTNRDSLHDAILMEIKYKHNTRQRKDILNIKFKGAYCDREFKFKFENILNLKYNTPNKDLYKVDLLIHQFQIIKDGLYRYEFIFSNGQKIIIDFSKLSIEEKFN